MSDAKNTTLNVVTEPGDFNEMIEFVNSEIAQSTGNKLGGV